jgi:hypothetical protein
MLKRSLDHDNVHLHLHLPMHTNIQLHAHKNVRLPREPFYRGLIPACFRLGPGGRRPTPCADVRAAATSFGRPILWVLARPAAVTALTGVRSALA